MSDQKETQASRLTVVGSLLLLCGCTEPSDRYQGVGEPREITAERSPATQPSLPTKGAPGAIATASPSSAAHSRDTDSPGSTTSATAEGAQSVQKQVAPTRPEQPRAARRATATFQTAPGAKLRAEAKLEEVEGGVHVRVRVGDAPLGRRGVHVHERGDCSDIAGKSMGGHFAPRGHRHGFPGYAEHHLGDLGNINISKHGDGELELTVARASLAGGDPFSFAGRSIVIHEGKDFGSREQPAGSSGEPVACAVINVHN